MKIICFTCRKPVKEKNLNSKTVLVEMDESRIHTCSEKTPEETVEREEEEASPYFNAVRVKKAA